MRGATVLITGGTGSFGKAFVKHILNFGYGVKKIIVLSRDELKQSEMAVEFNNDDRLRFFIGDVRDKDRLIRAFYGVDYVIHAAALKRIEVGEYNPGEFLKTNVLGTQNVVEAAITCGVKKCMLLSTDKACAPVNTYGKTKALAESLFVAGNSYSGMNLPRFSVVRYGNVLGSRGSVIHLFKEQAKTGTIKITDLGMTRFWITLDSAVQFVLDCLCVMKGGEIFVPKLPSMRVMDLAMAIAPNTKTEVIGVRPGEKIHEYMINKDESRHALDDMSRYIIYPEYQFWGQTAYSGVPVPEGFEYCSHLNDVWLSVKELKEVVSKDKGFVV